MGLFGLDAHLVQLRAQAGIRRVYKTAPMPGARQHITPVHHLAQFNGKHPEGCVWVYDRNDDKMRPAAPESAGFERHFYSLKRDDGSWDTQLDDWITGVEDKAHPIYQELRKGVIPVDDTQEKADFAVYLSTIWGRTKAMRRFVAEAYASHMQMLNHATAAREDVFDAHIHRLEKQFGEPISQQTREEVRKAMLDPSAWIIEIPKQRTMAERVWHFFLSDDFISETVVMTQAVLDGLGSFVGERRKTLQELMATDY